MKKVLVADEVWIATALLHRHNPGRGDFAASEILRQVETERVAGDRLRPGVAPHVYLHCVANKAPNSGRYRMLFETSKGRRRLFKRGDPCHPQRADSKHMPRREQIPRAYVGLIDWYRRQYAGEGAAGEADPILALRGVGKAIWADEEADTYVRRLRDGWLSIRAPAVNADSFVTNDDRLSTK